MFTISSTVKSKPTGGILEENFAATWFKHSRENFSPPPLYAKAMNAFISLLTHGKLLPEIAESVGRSRKSFFLVFALAIKSNYCVKWLRFITVEIIAKPSSPWSEAFTLIAEKPFLRTSTTQLVFIWWVLSGPSANRFLRLESSKLILGLFSNFRALQLHSIMEIDRVCFEYSENTRFSVLFHFCEWSRKLFESIRNEGGIRVEGGHWVGCIGESHGNYLRDLMGR